jgi:hypothetical protein
VSIDQNARATVAEPTASAIENEIPAYRAITRGAVFALLLGILSILSFASLYFLAFSALAVLVGWKADRRIQRYPDTFTGRGLAQAGFGLGLVFGLAAVSIVSVQTLFRYVEARGFARKFEEVAQKGSLNDVLWYMQPHASRESVTPEQLVKSLKGGSNAMMYDQMTANARALKKAIDDDQCTVHYDGLESHGDDGLSIFAMIRYELHAAKPAKPEDTERFALASCRAQKTDKRKYAWVVSDIQFPYRKGTYVAPEKPVDDGHGHGPGEHH